MRYWSRFRRPSPGLLRTQHTRNLCKSALCDVHGGIFYTYQQSGFLAVANLTHAKIWSPWAIVDRRPQYQRRSTQNDASELGLSFEGADTPFAFKWSILLFGTLLPYVLTDFSYGLAATIAADPENPKFQAVLERFNIARTLSSVLTVLGATSYSDHMLAFDYVTDEAAAF